MDSCTKIYAETAPTRFPANKRTIKDAENAENH